MQFRERLTQLLLRIHHDWTVPSDWLFERLPGDEEKSDSIVSGLDSNFIAPIEEYKRTVVRLNRRVGVQPLDGFCRHCERTRGIAEFPAACKNVSKGMTNRFYGKSFSLPGEIATSR